MVPVTIPIETAPIAIPLNVSTVVPMANSLKLCELRALLTPLMATLISFHVSLPRVS